MDKILVNFDMCPKCKGIVSSQWRGFFIPQDDSKCIDIMDKILVCWNPKCKWNELQKE